MGFLNPGGERIIPAAHGDSSPSLHSNVDLLVGPPWWFRTSAPLAPLAIVAGGTSSMSPRPLVLPALIWSCEILGAFVTLSAPAVASGVRTNRAQSYIDCLMSGWSPNVVAAEVVSSLCIIPPQTLGILDFIRM